MRESIAKLIQGFKRLEMPAILKRFSAISQVFLVENFFNQANEVVHVRVHSLGAADMCLQHALHDLRLLHQKAIAFL